MEKKFKILILDKNEQAWKSGRRILEETYDLFFYSLSGNNPAHDLPLTPDIDFIVMSSDITPVDYLDVLLTLKKACSLPIMVIMNDKYNAIDKIVALEMGADNIITRPFEWRELIARIRATIRLVQTVEARMHPDIVNEKSKDICFDGWVLDVHSKSLSHATRLAPELTNAEFKILEALLSNPKRVVLRRKLHDLCHQNNFAANDRSIDILIARLRRKLNGDEDEAPLIKTVRGVGYMLNVDACLVDHSPPILQYIKKA